MFYKKEGFPDDDEFVLCTVTSVQYNSVFCNLDEYPGKSGMIHISEVTAGRIRNIREYVQEGRKVVCKVLRIDLSKGHIDLSLRRVNERQRIMKNQELKQELKAENIIAYLSKEAKKEPSDVYKSVAPHILDKYEYIFQAFEDIVEENFSLSDTKIDKKFAEKLEAIVKERIKPKQVEITGVLSITTYAENGVEIVKNTLVAARDAGETTDIRYLGGGQYKVMITAEEYKEAEKRLKKSLDVVNAGFKKVPNSTVEFARYDD